MIDTLPYTFDGPYAGCFTHPIDPMDVRHIYMVHDVLMAWPFSTAAEIGSFYGASSTAFVEALKAGSQSRVTFCDTEVTEQLRRVAGDWPVDIREIPSWKLLADRGFEFVLLDASHDMRSVSVEVGAFLMRRPLCLMAHDTNATDAGYRDCEGSRFLRDVFRQMPDYQCIEDCERREGERTERGLFLATRSPELFEKAQGIFERWSQWEP